MISVTRRTMSAFSVCGRAERAHHRRGHVGIARAATGSTGASTASTRSARRRLRRRVRVRGRRGGRPAARPSPRAAAAPSTRSSGRRCRARRRPRRRRRASAPRRSRRRPRGRASRRAPAGAAPPGCGRARRGLPGRTRRWWPRRNWNTFRFLLATTAAAMLGGHGPARDSPTGCSPASCRSPTTTRSRPSGELAEVQPGPRVRRRLRQLGRGRHRRRARRRRHERRVPRQAGARDGAARGRRSRLDTAIFTHGHIDHVFGVDLYEEEARDERLGAAARRRARARSPERFDRYKLTAGYNAVINQRQFKAPGLRWPVEYRYPDETYRRRRSTLDVGGERFELHHARGETDDGDVGVGAGRAQVAVHGRPVHLGVAELRQPAEGAALRARLGRRVPHDGRARARGAAARPRPADRRRRPRAARRSPKAPSCSSRSSSRRSR